MSPRRFALFVAAILVSVFLAANALANVVLRGLRIDLTADHLYSLSPSTREILGGLAEPVDLTLYYSREAGARYPTVRAYASRVREMLHSFAGRSHGLIRIHEIDPVRFSEAEDAAVAAGVRSANAAENGEPVYLGLVGANAVDERRAIPVLSPEREAFLEYDITRVIAELESPRKLNVAIISTLPLDLSAARDQDGAGGAPLFLTELARSAEIEILPRDFSTIPPQASVLAILQPWPLSEAQAYAVDQFLMRRGRAFIALDPAAVGWDEGAASPFGAPPIVAPAADLSGVLRPWGVDVSHDVIADAERALKVETPDAAGRPAVAAQPLYFSAPADQMARDDLITASLNRQVNFAAPGAIAVRATDGVTARALIRSSRSTMRIPAGDALARPSPAAMSERFRPSGEAHTLAVRISGQTQSAFGAQAPPSVGSRADHLARSARPGEIVVVADVDFLNDGFYVGAERTPFADNAAFVLNALDLLSGADALIALRSRAPSARPLDVIEAMRRRAGQRLAATQAKLRQELSDSEARIATLQRGGGGSGFFAGDLGAELTAQEKEEMERFRARVLQVRNDLRATERAYRRDVDRLQGRLIFLNAWLIPLLVAGAGLYVSWRRQRRTELRP
ncbi:MAG: GldG family protein [Hyphomonadaceae bacterium]